jgi:hypothetical protein
VAKDILLNLLAYAAITVVGLALAAVAFQHGPGAGFAVLGLTFAAGVANGMRFRKRHR